MTEDLFRVDSWQNFLAKLERLYTLTSSLVKFCNALKEMKGNLLKTFLEKWPGFDSAVLGGVLPDGEYGEQSLAKAFKTLFGARVDTKSYCALKAEGIEAEVQVAVTVEDTAFQALLEFVEYLAKVALIAWEPGRSLPHPKNADTYGRNPVGAVQDAQEVLKGLADLSVGIEEKTTFLFMIRRITEKYLVATFPPAGNPEGRRFLEERLGLQRLWEPSPNPNGLYTLWGFRDYKGRNWTGYNESNQIYDLRLFQREGVTTFGGAVLTLNWLAWEVFHPEQGSAWSLRGIAEALFVNPPALPDRFRGATKHLLDSVKRPSVGDLNLTRKDLYLSLRGTVVEQYRYSRSGYLRSTYWEGSVYTFLDWLIPAVCYGEFEFEIEGNNLKVTPL